MSWSRRLRWYALTDSSQFQTIALVLVLLLVVVLAAVLIALVSSNGLSVGSPRR
jgi:hypothetical protein